uniref:Uncharacterized protein n=1 Tax=Arion vulgaris TaxID=1028688 RepID=A0A0B6ZNA4_9EUPU
MLNPDEENVLRRLYHYPAVTDYSDESIATFTQTRDKQINQLESIFSDLETKWFVDKCSYTKELHNFSLADFTGKNEQDLICLDSQQQTDLIFLCRSLLLYNQEREVTFIALHDFGCTLDDTELPHHISTPAQVRALQNSFKNILEHLPKPTLVTIARSSDDGYCPKEVVDQYQIDILKILENLFGSLQISKSYE